jgi:hypothetical protein
MMTHEERYQEACDRIAAARAGGRESLDLSELRLDRLPSEIGGLTSLRILRLGKREAPHVGLADLAPLQRLTGLTTLDLTGCKGVTDLGPLAKLAGLTALDLTGCKGVTDLGPLAKLAGLTALDLGFTGVTDLGPLAKLTGLTTLRLAGCKGVADLGPLAKLTGLTALHLAGCEGVTDLGPLAKLTGLTTLDLSSTGVTDLRPLAKLTGLTALDLSSTGVTDAAIKELADAHTRGELPNLRTLKLQETHTKLPETLVKGGDAREIFRFLRTAGRRPLDEAKLLLVGMGRVGKSHLLKRLFAAASKDREHYEAGKQPTHDVAMERWPAQNGRPALRAWDFGGQEYLHGSHRFFLGADHALYVLVLDATQDAQANRLHYWLRFADHHGRAIRSGERAPVVIVLNKCDVLTLAESQAGKKWPDGEKYRDNHRKLLKSLEAARNNPKAWHGARVVGDPIAGLGIFDPRKMSADEYLKNYPGQSTAELLEKIRQQHHRALNEVEERLREALKLVPGVEIAYEPAFHQLKDWLDEEFNKADPDTGALVERIEMTSTAWNQILVGNSLDPEDLPGSWLPTLRSLGVIHWIGDFDRVPLDHPLIEHTIFNPNWVKGPIYDLIQTPPGQHQHGVLNGNQQKQRLAGLKEPLRRAALALAKACQLAYRVYEPSTKQHTGELLVPDLLEVRERPLENWSGPHLLTKRLELDFLSDRVLLRYIGDHFHRIDDPQWHCFRNKVLLSKSYRLCQVLVESNVDPADGSAPYLLVKVFGDSDQTRKWVAEEVMEELARHLRAEGLLGMKEVPKIEQGTGEHLPGGTADPIEKLRVYIESQPSDVWPNGPWVGAAEALKRAGLKCDLTSFGRYRRGEGTLRAKDASFGWDKDGRVWKKFGDEHRYLECHINSPYPGFSVPSS